MSGIDGVNQNLFSHDLKKGQTMERNNEKKTQAVSMAAGKNASIQTNKLIIEMQLTIQIESKSNFGAQSGINMFSELSGIDLSQFQYNGKPITELSQDEAKDLISEDGFFGIQQTSLRIFDFAVNMAGDDLEKLQISRDAVLKGFKEAEQLFGGQLPEISHNTMDKVLELIDEKIMKLGGSVVDIKA